jgi:hypothetical protein
MYMNSIDRDIAATFGPITALVMKRKRALREYEREKHFRWYGDRHMREAESLEFEIIWALQTGTGA